MPVSTAMIKTLEDGFLRNQALDRLNLSFRRAGKEAPENIMAQEMTHIVRNILFSGIIPVDLLPEFNSLALELGEPLQKVQSYARHASANTTIRYFHDRQLLEKNPTDSLPMI